MTHQDAVNELAVERYLLGELTGDGRERFEEHLFDCVECAAEMKDSVLFLEAARTELRMLATASVAKKRERFAWPWQGWVLGPALAASLTLLVYQSAVVLPRMQTELASVETPTVVMPAVLANAGARGNSVTEVVAPRHGFYLLSVDLPPAAGVATYRCSLYSPEGKQVWHVDVPAQQAHDAVTIQVPAATAQEGKNELRVQAIPATAPEGATLEPLAVYRYDLRFAK